MEKYISILLGINVSGKNKIKITDLKLMYEGLGFKNVITYIQRGNVVFENKTYKHISREKIKNFSNNSKLENNY